LEWRCQFWLASAERERDRRGRKGSGGVNRSGQPAGVMPRVSEGAAKNWQVSGGVEVLRAGLY